jgi:hypothetical protein
MKSRRLPRASLLLGLALAAACRGTDYWVDKVQADPLYRRAEALRRAPACAALVPMEFGRTFPVPARGAGESFTVLFYPLDAEPGRAAVLTPVFTGRFARAAGGPDDCARLPAAGPERDLGPAVPAGLSVTAYYRAEARLFSALDRAATLYFSGPAAAGDKAALADFANAFETLAEPGLLADYYRENPDFWEWLRREGGRSIPKPRGRGGVSACAAGRARAATDRRGPAA